MISKERSSEGKHSQSRAISCSGLQHMRGRHGGPHTHQRKVIHGVSNQTCFKFWSFSYEAQMFFIFLSTSQNNGNSIKSQKLLWHLNSSRLYSTNCIIKNYKGNMFWHFYWSSVCDGLPEFQMSGFLNHCCHTFACVPFIKLTVWIF